MNLVSVGEVTLDHYLELQQTFVGGISLNFAVHAKRAGAKHVSLISRVGSEDGEGVLSKLRQEAVNTTFVRRVEGKTASIDIQILADGDRLFPADGYRENVLKDFRLSGEELRFIQTQDILVTLFSSQPNAPFQQLSRLEFSGKRVMDFGDWSRRKTEPDLFFESLEPLDLAFISGTKETVDLLKPYATKQRVIVVTLGAAGSVALRGERALHMEALKADRVVDTTGCGDAFQGAFTCHYFQTGDIQGALTKGTSQAARVLKHYGAS